MRNRCWQKKFALLRRVPIHSHMRMSAGTVTARRCCAASCGRPSAQSERLKAIGTVVDDRTLQGVQDEGGMLAISVFLQEAGVKPELLRRLLPGFSEEGERSRRPLRVLARLR